jgi:hypothetical protein
MINASNWRRLARLVAEQHARESPWNVPPPPGLDAAGLRLWGEWVAELAATPDSHARKVKRTALEEMNAELVGIACRVLSGG